MTISGVSLVRGGEIRTLCRPDAAQSGWMRAGRRYRADLVLVALHVRVRTSSGPHRNAGSVHTGARRTADLDAPVVATAFGRLDVLEHLEEARR